MLADKFLIKLINEIRKCPFLKKYDYILKHSPTVNVNYIENQRLELSRICFSNWDEITITKTAITFFPEHGSKEILLSYNSWDELYNIFNIKEQKMKCYRQGGCGPYEMIPCNECPASKPEYLKKADTAHWIWDPNGIDWNIGAWRCSKCQTVNLNIGHNSKINPMNYTGSKYCPNCGLKISK